MTWRERIQEARERERRIPRFFRPIVKSFYAATYWPFVPDDNRQMTGVTNCAAAEVSRRYGIGWTESGELFELGNQIQRAIHNQDLDLVENLYDQIEDRALELKRRMG